MQKIQCTERKHNQLNIEEYYYIKKGFRAETGAR